MSLIAKSEGKTYPVIEAGSYHAVCYSVIDLGTHYNQRWNKKAHKIIITWELPEERIDIERNDETINIPRSISKEYTLSIHDKSNLGRDLTCWRGVAFTDEERDGFDILSIVGANCILQIINEEKERKVYANVQAVTKLLKNMNKLKPENQIRTYSMAQNAFRFPDIPDWILEKIKHSEEYQAISHAEENQALRAAQESAGLNENQQDDDDIPF